MMPQKHGDPMMSGRWWCFKTEMSAEMLRRGGGRGWPHKSFVSVSLYGYYNWSGFVPTEVVILDILEDGVKYGHMLTLSSRAVPSECSLTHINTGLEYHLPSKMGFP